MTKKFFSQLKAITLIEFIIFIIVVTVTALTIFEALNTALSYSWEINARNRAMEFAMTRMNLILANKSATDFATFDDPCTEANPPTICSEATAAGYTVTATISNKWNNDSNYKEITVQASTADVAITLTTLVGNNEIT